MVMRTTGSSGSNANVIGAVAAAAGRMAAALLVVATVSATAASPEQIKPSASTPSAQEAPLQTLDAVLDELRKGGLVIYFRHGITEQTGPKDEAADLAVCATQRNLSAEGRDQAAQIGKAFHALGITVGTVTTSPFCRCRDTAKLAFGRFTVNNDLYFAIDTDAERTKQLAGALRRTLSTPPLAGTNAVIVSHTANLREAAGIWPKPEGVAYVFRPLPGGRYEVVARVSPEEWVAAAKRK
jgi:phosphohistidine phosphatase SixA